MNLVSCENKSNNYRLILAIIVIVAEAVVVAAVVAVLVIIIGNSGRTRKSVFRRVILLRMGQTSRRVG